MIITLSIIYKEPDKTKKQTVNRRIICFMPVLHIDKNIIRPYNQLYRRIIKEDL